MVQSGGRGAGARVVAAIKERIHAGVYRTGDRMPSTRLLAAEWGMSRTTVTAAYEQLIAEGYLEARQGAATRVSRRPGGARAAPSPDTARPIRLSLFGERVLSMAPPVQALGGSPPIDFRYGEIAGADFPTLAWSRALGRAAMKRPARLRYEDAQGSEPLRVALREYIWRARGVRCESDQIVVVNGSQQGIDLCARVLINPGDRVILENPTYPLARDAFLAAGAALAPIAVDEEGIGAEELPDARLAYVTPSHQFPLGHVMSAARRNSLVAWARRSQAYIVEDDYDGEYRYDVEPIPPLHVLDSERVIYVGTVSKTLSPTLRLGYLVAPPGLQKAFAGAKRLIDRHAPALEQHALTDFLESGAYERHVRSTRRRNRARRSTLMNALARSLGRGVTLTGVDAGLHIVCWFPDISADAETAFIRAAREANLGVYPVSASYDPSSSRPASLGLVLGYAGLSLAEIEEGAQMLARVVEHFVTPPAIDRANARATDERG